MNSWKPCQICLICGNEILQKKITSFMAGILCEKCEILELDEKEK